MLPSYRGYLSFLSLKPTPLSLHSDALPRMSPTILVMTLSFLLILSKFQLTLGFRPNMPKIGPGFSISEVRQLKDAFDDAMEIAVAATEPTIQIMNSIFIKYFDYNDRWRVVGETPVLF